MNHSIELPLAEPDRRLLAEKLAPIEGPWTGDDFTPHLSLAVIRDEADPGVLREIVGELAAQIPRFRLRFSSIGLFPGRRPVLFLAPVASEQLLAAHQLSSDLLAQAGISPINYYQRGRWSPHLTLSTGVPALKLVPKVKELLRLEFAGDYGFEAIDLIEFHPATRLARLPLV